MTYEGQDDILYLTYKVKSGVADLEVTYRTNGLKKVCTNASEAKKEYGNKMEEKIMQRINELKAADSIEMLVQFQIGRCHPLKGNRNGQYAMDLIHPYRLVFIKAELEFQSVKILEIEDYH